MPTSASELVSNTGNAALGFGSNPNISAAGSGENANLNILNQTARDVMLLQNERAMKLFQQKVQDRDDLKKMIASDQVATGEIDPMYQKYFDYGKKEVEVAFKKWNGNPTDTEGYRNYKSAVSHLQDIATHAQVNSVELAKLRKEKSDSPLPQDQKAYDDWISKQTEQPFWNEITPYQKTHELDMGEIRSFAKKGTRQVMIDGIPYNQEYADWDGTLQNANDHYINQDAAAHSIDLLYNYLQGLQQSDPDKFNQNITAANAQLTKHGLSPIDIEEGVIKEPKTSLAAKWALSGTDNYATSPDDKLAKVLTDRAKLGIEAMKANADILYKKLMGYAANKKANAYAANLGQQMKLRANDKEQDDLMADMWRRNFLEQPTLITPNPKNHKLVGLGILKANNTLPFYTIDNGGQVKQLIAIGAKPHYKDDDYTKDKKLKANAKPQYYEGGTYKVKYILDGKIVPEQEIANFYNNFKRNSDANGNKWSGSIDDFIKEAIRNNKVKAVVEGANGSTDEELSKAAMRLISNKNTKKGQEGVFSSNDNPTAEDAISTPNPNE